MFLICSKKGKNTSYWRQNSSKIYLCHTCALHVFYFDEIFPWAPIRLVTLGLGNETTWQKINFRGLMTRFSPKWFQKCSKTHISTTWPGAESFFRTAGASHGNLL